MSALPPAVARRLRYAFVFVCQAGELEIKALLLAASLKRFMRCDYELIAALPAPASVWGEPAAQTRALLQQLGVRLEPIVNPIDPDYKIGNKLACLDVPTRADKIVFLDSDILCLRDLGDPACLAVPFAAKAADLRTFAAGTEAWQPLYEAAGVALPALRMPTTVSGEFGLAYFNSGVIFADAAAGVGRAWIECARAIQHLPSMRQQRHWLDQVSLPIAVHRLGLAYAGLDERFNFPAHLKPLPDELPFLCHYHWPRIVQREPILFDLMRELIDTYPAIAQSVQGHPDWAALLAAPPPVAPRRVVAPALAKMPVSSVAIGGLPDSGAQELLDLLRGCGQCVVRDEPLELLAPLAAAQPLWEVAAYLRDLHGSAAGTADSDSRTDRALPAVGIRAASDRVVAVKSELAFVCRLDALKRVLPDARLIACIRNPYDTIAAWKARPPQAIDAAMAWVATAGEQWLTAREQASLRRIVALDDAAERRAAWWWWLAQRLLDHAHGVVIVRHRDLLADPVTVFDTILPGVQHDPRRQQRVDSIDRDQSTSRLDERDLQAIRAICLQPAAELGVGERDA